MARESTLGEDWLRLAEAYGGVMSLAKELGVSYPTLYRIARNMLIPDEMLRSRIIAFAEAKGVPTPMQPTTTKKPKVDDLDLQILRLLGEAIDRGTPMSAKIAAAIETRLGEAALIDLAESDQPPAIHKAVAALLGGL